MNKIIVFFLLILSLTGCTSRIQDTAVEHKLTAYKWKELAEYAGLTLDSYRVTIAASITLNDAAGVETLEYMISDIHLTSKILNKEVDLLAPSFERQFVCNTNCYPVNELQPNHKEGTLLIQVYRNQEIPLFEFYGELTKINEKIETLKALAPEKLKRLMYNLTLQRKSFKTIEEFIDFFKGAFTQDHFIKFEQKERFGKLYLVDETQNWTTEDVTNGLPASPPDYMRYIDKEEDGNQEVLLGSMVCTFSDSSFGVLVEKNETNVLVALLGKALLIRDGVLITPPFGYLFSNMEAFDYSDVKLENKLYNINDIGKCNLALN